MISVYFVLKDFFKKPLTHLILILQIVVATIFTIVILRQLNTLSIYRNNFNRLNNYKYTYFEAYFPKDYDKVTGEFDISLLQKVFSNKDTFSYIRNIRDDNGKEVVIGVGNFEKIYDINSSNELRFLNIYKGNDIKDDKINIHQLGIINKTPDYIIKNKAFYLVSAMETLDDKILVTMDFETFKEYVLHKMDVGTKRYALIDIYSNLKFVKLNQEETDKLITNASTLGGFKVTEHDFNKIISNQLKISTDDVLITGSFTLFFILFLIIGLAMFLINILYGNLREYAILKMYGATNTDIITRLSGNVLIIVLIPFIILALFGNKILGEFPILEILTVFLIVYIVIVFIITTLFIRTNEIKLLRRNN